MLIKFFNIFKLELYLWFESIMKFIPGKIGILLRIIFYSIVKNKFFFVSISTGTSIRNIKSIEIEKGVGIGPNCFIDSTGGNIFIGQKSAFNESCHINSSVGGKIILGEKVIFGPKVLVRTANHNYSKANTSIQDSGHFFADIIIEDNCWIGGNSTILGGVKIGKGSVIGAGAVVTKNIPNNSIAVGVPAKVIKKIDYAE